METELFYYRNPTGLIAVSFDQGETIVLPSGKRMEYTHFWEELPDDHHSELTPEQDAVLKSHLEIEDKSEMGQIIRKYRQRRLLQERLDGITPEPTYRKLPEDVMVVVADFD